MPLSPDTEAGIFFGLLLFCVVAFIGGCIGIIFFGWLSIGIGAVVSVIALLGAGVVFVRDP